MKPAREIAEKLEYTLTAIPHELHSECVKTIEQAILQDRKELVEEIVGKIESVASDYRKNSERVFPYSEKKNDRERANMCSNLAGQIRKRFGGE